MTPKVSERIKFEEGFEPSVYQDSLGFWTIGYGFLVDEKKGGRIPKAVAEFWLKWEIERLEKTLFAMYPWWNGLDAVRQDVLLLMAYQLGLGGLSRFRNMIKAIARRDYTVAAREALDSVWAKQTPARARRLARMLETGEG